MRFLFMPDLHLRRDRNSPKGIEASLNAAMKLNPKPQFIVTGGDLIDDMRSMTPEQADEMAALFQRIWRDNTDLPTYHALGNHDVAGLTNDEFPPDHPLFGAQFLKEKLAMPGLFYSFDREGWHFVVLYNVEITPDKKMIGAFSKEQMAFLKDDLAGNAGKPTFVIGHYPPVSAIEFFDGNAKQEDSAWQLGYGRACRNPMALIEAIGDADVKAFFSGHIHRLDRIEAKGQTFICAGSVSGDKWKGPQVDTPEGFAVVDCGVDGSYDYQYTDYGWKAAAQ